MHHKAIKAEIRKQLKTQYPNWQRLTKEEIAKKVKDQGTARGHMSEIKSPVVRPARHLPDIAALHALSGGSRATLLRRVGRGFRD